MMLLMFWHGSLTVEINVACICKMSTALFSMTQHSTPRTE
jgi:hypothetical protein